METPSTNTQALPAGTRIEEFMIERVLGSGGFGITYLARDVSLNRPVVIKENLPAQFAWRETASGTVRSRHSSGGDADDYQWSMNNFLREAEMLASLDHPGIVRVLRKFEANGTAYFVMPYLDGVAFDELIKERHANDEWFTEVELVGVLTRLLPALDYLHARGIYHRDIKPGNILITTEGIPVLIDFGSARQRLSERSMTVVESAGYTPFEQLQSRGEIGPWSDLYALGATMVKAITGEAPPKAADRVMGDPWKGLSRDVRWNTIYTASFLQAIDQALSVASSHRWQSGEEWLLEMNALPSIGGLAGAVHTPGRNSPSSVPVDSGTQAEPRHVPVQWEEARDNSVKIQSKASNRRSKSIRQSLVAGVCGLAVAGVAFLTIKNSGKHASPVQAETLEQKVAPPSAAEVEPAAWRKMAEAGDPFAQALLGDALYWGGMRAKGIQIDQAEGKKWILASAEVGHPLGLFLRGLATESGKKEAADKDFATAIEKGLLRDVENGGPAWWTAVALHLSRDKENLEQLKQAREWRLKAAATGYIDAMTQLAESYGDGLGVEKNPSLAAHWYRKAAEAGSPEAMTRLALHYRHGAGVKEDHAEAVRWFRKAADLGDAEAQTCLGDAYTEGKGVPKDLKQAAHWYQQAAEQGDVNGQTFLAMAYEEGEGVPKDLAMAAEWYRKAAEQGDASAQSSLGDLYLEGEGVPEDPDKAIKLYRLAAGQGNHIAQNRLGECYLYGKGVAKDAAAGVQWLRKSAEQGFALAQNQLGNCYLNGVGVEKDPAAAAKWYQLGAEEGFALSQANLGFCYAKGIGLGKNEIEAVRWYRKAADYGYAQAQWLLAGCYASGHGVDQDPEQAAKWYRKAADDGYADAQYDLALCYYRGEGVLKNSTAAVKWCHMAADQNHIQAQYDLGYLCANGEGVAKDMAEAAKWYRKAAEQGHVDAQDELGRCYANGHGVVKNLTEAIIWYRKAAEQGNQYSQCSLGHCYAKGDGVSRNPTEAAKWYLKAAEQGHKVAQNNLGICYAEGTGVYKDPTRGLMWLIISSESGNDQARENMRITANEMTPSQISQARRMAAEWRAREKAGDPFVE